MVSPSLLEQVDLPLPRRGGANLTTLRHRYEVIRPAVKTLLVHETGLDRRVLGLNARLPLLAFPRCPRRLSRPPWS